MANFANLTANLNLNIQNFANGIRRAATLTNQFSANLRGQINNGLAQPAKKAKFEFKDVARIVQGIIISKVFYGGLNAIRQCVNAVWEFGQQLEYAKMAYSNLFGDTALAEEFINVLKDFAATTSFSFSESEAAAKRLLAYGIQYKNVMYVMQGVLSASAMQGNPQVIESVSRAIGQIYTKGRLMNEEMRQLAEAGIPAYEILQEKLGLTAKQLQNLGKQAIPADIAINALVDGMNERFGGVVASSNKTLKGLISNIKDNATMIIAGAFEPVFTFLKSMLSALSSFLFKMREIFELKGLGGVFEAIFPPELHATLRQFIANLGEVLQAILRLANAFGSLWTPVIEAFMRVFNAFAPILVTVTNVLSVLVKMITSNATAMKWLTAMLAAAAAMWVVFKVKALASAAVAGVISLISKALAVLSTMLTFVVTHPFWTLLMVMTGVVVGLSGGFGKLSDAISSVFKKITAFNGIDPDKVLLPSQKERANDINKFNKALDGTKNAMDDLADSTGKATKAAKGLLSFDEAFKLNQPDEGTDKGIGDIELPDFGDIEIPDMSDALTPEIPDFSDYMNELTGGFLDKLKSAWEGIKDKIASIISTAIGAAFGALMGALLGGKLFGILGAIIGAIVGYFWNKLADAFGLSPDQKVRAGIIGGICSVIGAIIGGILGGPLGAKIGAIIGALVGSFWGIFAEYLGVLPEQHLATAINGLITGLTQFCRRLWIELGEGLVATYTDDVFSGFARTAGFSLKSSLMSALKQGVLGAIVGLVTGMLANALTGWIAKELELTDQDLKNSGVGQTIGNIIGSIVGMILGGPIGSLVGGALGQLAGAVVGEFWAYLTTTLKGTIIGGAAGLPIGALVGTLVGSLGGPLGAALGAAIGAALGAVIGAIVEHWDAIKQWFSDIGNGIATFFSDVCTWFADGWSNLVDGVGGFFEGIGQWFSQGTTDIGNWLNEIWTSISTSVSEWFAPFQQFFADVAIGIGSFALDLWNGITTVFNDIGTAIGTVLSDIWTAITTVFNDICVAVGTVMLDIWSAITTVWNDIVSAVTTVCTTIWGTISNIFGLIFDLIAKVVSDIWNAIVQWFTPIAEEIGRVCTEAWNAVSSWFTNIYTSIVEKVTEAWNAVSTWFTNIWNTISEKLSNTWNTVKTFFGEILISITSRVTDAWTTVSTWFTKIWNTVKEKLTGTWTAVKTIFSNIYNSIKTKVSDSYNSVKNFFGNMYSSVKDSISNMYNSVKNGISNIYNTFTNWISNMWNNVFGKFFGWINDAINKLREFFGLESNAKNTANSYSNNANSNSGTKTGHARGGVFNREHVARFAEGNKAEAVIPLENAGAMQPFVDAVANGITASLMPIVANISGSQTQLQPLYVGTLIADERSLKELNRKMQVIQLQENKRRG